jgi:hypothetical protein
MRLLPILILVTGCATATATADGDTREQRELSAELQGRTAGKPQSCVPSQQGRSLQIVDRRTLVYRDRNAVYVNRLDADCPGLRPLNTLVIEAHGSETCRGDRVRGVEPGSSIPGPFCVLRDFVPYRPRG